MGNNGKEIIVYAHWQGMDSPEKTGTLFSSIVRGKEIFSFEYSQDWLSKGWRHIIDPDLQFYSGPQYAPSKKQNFGIFLDSSPDRWGRVLMKRREALEARLENRPERQLYETDFLLGVDDKTRMGGLRFKTAESDDFLENNPKLAVPPWSHIRELEAASLHLENADAEKDSFYNKWLTSLMAPGSSLGGARPKAGVVDSTGALWIAKFPSKNDTKDIGAWEITVHDLAIQAGLQVSDCKAQPFYKKHHTFLTKRFDRTITNERIHFSSAMNMLGYSDGADSAIGVSYLEIAEFLVQHGAATTQDLHELWRRIVFYICVSNTDDHLRNHGFLLTSEGWRLSPAYDINPVPNAYGLSLNINENDNSLDTDLALSVAPYFRISKHDGEKIIKEITSIVQTWPIIAKRYSISKQEQEEMQSAFRKAFPNP